MKPDSKCIYKASEIEYVQNSIESWSETDLSEKKMENAHFMLNKTDEDFLSEYFSETVYLTLMVMMIIKSVSALR